jgi:hypothetical protein
LELNESELRAMPLNALQRLLEIYSISTTGCTDHYGMIARLKGSGKIVVLDG